VEAGLAGLRFHDLRHPITKLAEAGVPDHTLMAIAGHVNREMLEHYSHIRMQAKRGAVAALGRGKEEMSANSEVPVVEVSEMAVFHPVCWLPRSSWCKIDLILMRLSACIRLGPYEIVAPIGKGGTGDVCKFRKINLLHSEQK